MIAKLFFLLLCAFLIKNGNTIRVKRIVGGKAAAKPPPDDPVVFTKMYNRDARVEGFRNVITGIYSFLGLRYADPPTGQNRFTRPRYRRLQGDINATKYGPPCPQPHSRNPNAIIGDEDCLLLNIYTPQMPDETTGLPVYIWIHPGAFRFGSAAQYDAEPLAQQGTIFIPIQYRLGTLGIIGDGTKEFSGNLAMFDMEAALRWVTEYISFFGGDPKKIKVIGHGSGATSAMYLSMSRLPRSGSITGVVAMSGSALSQYANDEKPIQSTHEIAEINNCPETNEIDIVNCLRSKNVKEIVLKDSQVQVERLHGHSMVKALAGNIGFNPHVEKPDDARSLPGLITEFPSDSIAKNNFSTIPLLIGVTKEETGNAINLEAIENIWGSADKLLDSLVDSLTNLKSFLRIDKASGLVKNAKLPGVQGLTITLNDLLKVTDSLNPSELLSKITNMTTDAFFNIPAILTAQSWGKSAPSFLYSFEYKSKKSKGIHFLRNLPIVSSNEENNNFIAHGDDLGFLFNVNDIEGNPIPETKLTEPTDLQVRHNMISLLTNFANLAQSTNNSIFRNIIPGGKGTPFIKIDAKLQLLDEFRLCELLIWGVPLNPLDSSSCEGLSSTLLPVKNILTNITSKLTGAINANPEKSIGGSILKTNNFLG